MQGVNSILSLITGDLFQSSRATVRMTIAIILHDPRVATFYKGYYLINYYPYFYIAYFFYSYNIFIYTIILFVLFIPFTVGYLCI